MNPREIPLLRGRLMDALLLCLILICATTTHVPAQAKSDKLTKESEKIHSVWKLQSQSVAQDLGLSKEKSGILEKAYLAARQSQASALKSLPEETDRQKSRAAIEQLKSSEREKLKASLKDTFSEKEIARILPSLATFNKNWDKYLATLRDFGLPKSKMTAAQKVLIEYVVEYEQARERAVASEGRFSKKNSQPYKDTLDAGLSKILTANQLKMWKEASTTSKSGASSQKQKVEKPKEAKGKQPE
ncbi:MAG: hypothetical protein WBD36_05490 [Bacteroidota bacterium]